jgi:hypothetical protein
MPVIFDLFGFPLYDRSMAVEAQRKDKHCPFMGDICDGGGNRWQTEIKLTPEEPLTKYFNPGIKAVVPGVCSIVAGGDAWVVCPRRLLAARHTGEGLPPVNRALQSYERDLLLKSGLPTGVDLGIWNEVTVKHTVADAEINYHFDYIAAPLMQCSLSQYVEGLVNTPDQVKSELAAFQTLVKKYGYARPTDDALEGTFLPDVTHPYILEVMTASTSGSDTKNETDMRNAFRNALLASEHSSPGINKRQVWGRMVTHLFAKSALAEQWKGKTIWIIQDQLLRNIELTTRLRTSSIKTKDNQNITVAVMHYEADGNRKSGMAFKTLLQGDAGIDFAGNDTFTDILLPKTAPPKIELVRAMLRRKLAAIVHL